jgi:hypothetical protein
MRDLWLRFLTEIDENTDDADPELLANEETFEALELLRRSAFTPGELLAYNQYWLNISTEKSAMERERREGHEEGLVEGEKLGIQKSRKETAIAMLKEGMPVELITKISKLSPDEIIKLKSTL